MLRNQVFVLDHMYMSLFSTLGWILRLGVTMALLASIHPALILLAVFAIPTVLTSTWRPAVERSAQERGAQTNRLATPPLHHRHNRVAGKEVASHRHWRTPCHRTPSGVGALVRTVAGGAEGLALWHGLAWAIFGFAYVGAVVFVSSGLRAPAAQVLLVLRPQGRDCRRTSARTVGEVGFFLRGFLYGPLTLGSRELEDYAASRQRQCQATIARNKC